jgi:Fic family protein
MAVQNGLLDAPILYLSPRLENHKDENIALMHNVSTRSEWSPWINFFLCHLEETCKDAIGTINDLINLHQSFREKAQSAGRSVRLIEIVDMLFETPVTTIPRVQDRLSVTYAAARQLVAKLVEAGILREVDSHPKYFVADDIFRICRPASHE